MYNLIVTDQFLPLPFKLEKRVEKYFKFGQNCYYDSKFYGGFFTRLYYLIIVYFKCIYMPI